MGLFEEYPWLLVPLILAVVAAYDFAKWGLRTVVSRSRETPEPVRQER